MSTAALRADGRPVSVEGVTIVSPGLRGQVDVLRGGDRGLRGADAATDLLVQALEATAMQEQRTIVIHDHSQDSAALATSVSRSTRYGQPGLALTVPGPGSGMAQVMLAVDEAGVISWLLPDDVPAAEAATRGGDTRTYTIPVAVAERTDDSRRGLLAVVGKKVLKVLAFRLLDEVASGLANLFATRWEKTAHPHLLRTFGPADYRQPAGRALTAEDLLQYRRGPCLLFIHGEMSSSHSCFAHLPPEVLTALYELYQGRVLAFDHPSVSVTPTANAAWLAEQVRGCGLVLDVVAHSRGGLVGRVLAERLEEVAPGAGPLALRRLVMVATPNRGTVLADADRLNDLVERVTNLLELVPDNGFLDVLTVVISVVKQLAVGAYHGLDGLTALAPGASWLGALNQDRPVSTAYFAVSSNYEPAPGSPLVRVARDRVADLVFKKDGNDLVVPEAGVHAANGARPFPVADPLILGGPQSVDHSGYWSSPALHARLREWLPG